MSILTTTPLLVAPSAADNLNIVTSGGAWTNGAWVEFLAATSAADTAVAGVCITDAVASPWTGLQLEVGIGIGALGEEVEIGHIRLAGPASGNGGPSQYLLPFPVSGITIGTRVCLRYRTSAAASFTWPAALLYYEDLDSDQHVPYTVATLTSYPSGADSILLTPSATPWNNSAWGEFDPAVGVQSYVFGIAVSNPTGATDDEVEIGIGAAAAEVGLTTVRFGAYGGGRLQFVSLPGLMPIAEASRLAGRLRKSGTATDPVSVAYLGYAGPLDVGTLIIEKVTAPSGSPQAFSFSTPGLTPSTFDLTDGQTQTFTDLEPGVYSVEEIDIPAGWTLASVVVSNDDDPSAITIGAGDTVTVTFTNTQGSTLIVQKVTDPLGEAQEFDFTASGGLDPAEFTLADGEQQIYADVAPGVYGFEETPVPAGWTLTNVTVSNGDPVDAIEIAEGETVTVVFTNTQNSECPGERTAPILGG